jgi:hypothetical protein
MEFRLLYSGRVLGASRNNSRASLKHEIRREFHPQLKRLWQINESLREIVKRTGYSYALDHRDKYCGPDPWPRDLTHYPDYDHGDSLYRDLGADVIPDNWARAGYRFHPLVTEAYCVRCALDILFLRPEDPGFLILSGDVDARIKTIFDALRMPKNLDETGGVGPQSGEDPFFCLLEDDKLISEVKVSTDQLLLLPREREIKPNDALLVIHVKLWPAKQSGWEWAFY